MGGRGLTHCTVTHTHTHIQPDLVHTHTHMHTHAQAAVFLDDVVPDAVPPCTIKIPTGARVCVCGWVGRWVYVCVYLYMCV
jgi:hypothetical protein